MSFRPNPTFEAEMENDPDFRAFKMEKARDAAASGRAVMPLGEDKRRGHVRDKIKARSPGGEVQVALEDGSLSHLPEFGSSKNPSYAPLRRGVRAAGMRLVEALKS